MHTHKICSRCLTAKPRTTEYFYRNKSYIKYGERDGLQPYCKDCDDEKRTQRYTEHIEEELTRAAEYRENNPDIVVNAIQQWRVNNREKYNEYMRNYRAANKQESTI